MKILYIAHTTDKGGGTIALLNLIDGIRQYHEVAVMLPSKHGWLKDELVQRNIQCYYAHYYLSIYSLGVIFHAQWWNVKAYLQFVYGTLKKIFFNHRAHNRLREVIADFQPAIVHCNCGPLAISINVCKKIHIPHVWHLREYQGVDFHMVFMPTTKCFMKLIHQSGNYNISITKGVFNHFKLRPKVDQVIYDGVFDYDATPMPDEKRDKTILFVGRIEEAKGVMDLIEAFISFHQKHPDYQLKLVGGFSDIPYLNHCKSVVERNGLNAYIEFCGECSDIYIRMRKAKCCVVPSHFEGFGFITAEAMLNGCLVIGRNTSGTKEQMDRGVELTGSEIALRFTTQKELEHQLEVAVCNEYYDMRQRAFDVVVKSYTNTQLASQLCRYYEWIVKREGQ